MSLGDLIDGSWWAEYLVEDLWEGPVYCGRTWKRKRVLKLVGINGGRFMFSVFPTKLWVLLSAEEVRRRYQEGTFKEIVIQGGKR